MSVFFMVDLELSGHTHAGQIWPVGLFSELAGVLNYGEYEREGCKVIVSSLLLQSAGGLPE